MSDIVEHQITMTEEELVAIVQASVREVMQEHACQFTGEERSILYDVILGGRIVKRTILTTIAMAVVGAIAYVAGKLLGGS